METTSKNCLEKIIIESVERIITFLITVTGADGGFMQNKAACNFCFLQLLSYAGLATFKAQG